MNANVKKSIPWIIIVILLIVAIFVIYFLASRQNDKEAEIEQIKSGYVGKLALERNKVDSIQNLLDETLLELDTCENGLVRELTPEEENAALKQELEALKSKPAPVTRNRITTRTSGNRTTKPDVTETTFTNTFSAPKKTPVITETSYVADDSELPITNYEGGISGDFGTTISGDGHLIYFIKTSIVANNKGNIAPRLNGESGGQFTLDSKKGYWFYVDNRLISGQEINSASYAVTWNIFIGHVNYGTGSYPAYLPHQSLKSLINNVRGFEYGEITQSDLTEMAKSNSSIANGTIKPLRLSSSPGHDNANFWHGWNFVTKIYAKKKIVTSMNMGYPKNIGYRYVYSQCA